MRHLIMTSAIGAAILASTGCGDILVLPAGPAGPDTLLVLSAPAINALDSTGHAIVRANPENADLEALVDSTLLVLTAGIQAKQTNVATDLTDARMYFVGVHRVFVRPGSSSSTWSVVGFDDPAHLANLIEVTGFAQQPANVAPASVGGTIGDGTGVVNGLLLAVGSNGAVTEWRATSGAVQIVSDAPGGACPNFTSTAVVTCSVETMHVLFAIAGPSVPGASGAASSRSASVSTVADIPGIRLTFTPP